LLCGFSVFDNNSSDEMEDYVEESHPEGELDDGDELFQSLDDIEFLESQL